jgi:hypothetical protein
MPLIELKPELVELRQLLKDFEHRTINPFIRKFCDDNTKGDRFLKTEIDGKKQFGLGITAHRNLVNDEFDDLMVIGFNRYGVIPSTDKQRISEILQILNDLTEFVKNMDSEELYNLVGVTKKFILRYFTAVRVGLQQLASGYYLGVKIEYNELDKLQDRVDEFNDRFERTVRLSE